MTEAENHPDSGNLVTDGDLLHDIVANACPYWMSDTAARELADRVVADLAMVPEVTVVRGPDSKPWAPAERLCSVDPDAMVADVVANAALDGRLIDEDWKKVLRRIATGDVTADSVIATEVERATGALRGKLVRDRIPDIIRRDGQTPVIETATPEDYPKYVRAKLVEELGEYLESGDVAELADLIEVCFCAALTLHDVAKGALLSIAQRKNDSRGGFRNQLVWMGNQAADGDEGASGYSAVNENPNPQETA